MPVLFGKDSKVRFDRCLWDHQVVSMVVYAYFYRLVCIENGLLRITALGLHWTLNMVWGYRIGVVLTHLSGGGYVDVGIFFFNWDRLLFEYLRYVIVFILVWYTYRNSLSRYGIRGTENRTFKQCRDGCTDKSLLDHIPFLITWLW